jgi:hypothetical protein
MVPIFVVGFIVDRYCLSIYIWPLLFILLLMPIIVVHYCLSCYCRLLLSSIIVYPIIVNYYFLSFYNRPLLFIHLFSAIIGPPLKIFQCAQT